jgi:PAS domain-containing protein
VPVEASTGSTLSIEKVIAGETLHTTARRRRKDGQILDLEVHAVPLVVAGSVRGSYMIYEDISEQIRASEAERKHAEVLNQLVAELQLRTKQMTLLSGNGRSARVLRDNPGGLRGCCPVGAETLAGGPFRNVVPVQVVAQPG